MKTSAYTCTCGRKKDIANRWLLGILMKCGGATWACLSPWNDVEADRDDVLVLCSEQCAYKWLASELERMGR